MSLREQVSQHKINAEARITSILSATAVKRDIDDGDGAVSTLNSWEGRGVYTR